MADRRHGWADPLDGLPHAYATALRLRSAGVSDDAIAERLGVEFEAIETLMQLAQAKLDRLPR